MKWARRPSPCCNRRMDLVVSVVSVVRFVRLVNAVRHLYQLGSYLQHGVVRLGDFLPASIGLMEEAASS